MIKRIAVCAAAGVIGAGFLTATTSVTTTAGIAGAPRCHGHDATIVGTTGDDTVRGTKHRDVIVGLGGADRIRGRGGNDVLCGGPARDRLYGGRGNDRLDGGAFGDKLAGGPGADRVIDPMNGMTWNPSEHDYDGVPNMFIEGPGHDVMRGRKTAETDVLTFRDSRVPVHLNWRRGTARTDTWNEFSNVEHVVGSRFADVIRGRNRADKIHGGPGADVIAGRGGDDVLVGTYTAGEFPENGPAKDVLRGGAGDDTLMPGIWYDAMGHVKGVGHGGPGDDFIVVAPAGGRYAGGAGHDRLVFDDVGPARIDLGREVANADGFHVRFTGADKYIAWDHDGSSTVIGSPRADDVDAPDAHVDGNGGNDVLTGRSVSGGPGDDRLTHYGKRGHAAGGLGNDRIVGSGTAFGGVGDDLIRWDGGTAYGGKGDDSLHAMWSPHTHLLGGAGHDKLYGRLKVTRGRVLDGGPGINIATSAPQLEVRTL